MEYPAHQQLKICLALAFIGGFMEAYTYLLKGSVFANAQTGNMVLMVLEFIYFKDPVKGAFYLIPISFYVLGILLTVSLPARFCGRVSWYTLFIIIEFAAFAVIGALPQCVPDAVTTVAVSFLSAMQYNTFKSFRGVAMSTVFCTNNLRQLTIAAAESRHEDRYALIKRGVLYLMGIIFFLFGAFGGALIIKELAGLGMPGERSIWICCLMLVPMGLYMHFYKGRTDEG